MPGAVAPILAVALTSAGCGSDETTTRLEPIVLGMTSGLAPAFDDGETQFYEVKLPVQLPLVAPTDGELADLRQKNYPPFRRAPWVIRGDVTVQVTWTLTNLDAEPHNVHLLLDPWNEFGRYWPGVAVVDEDEQIPNLSGIQFYFEMPGTRDSRPSRRHGTITFEDMDELAVDFSTVMNIIENVPPPDPTMGGYGGAADPVTLVNHAFNPRNRSSQSPLTDRYVPSLIAGLTGFDLGLRTMEPANVAVEIVVELVDDGKGRVAKDEDHDCQNGACTWLGDADHRLIREPRDYVTVGGP